MAGTESVHTVPLSCAYNSRSTARAKRSVGILRAYVARHAKTEQENVNIGADVNDYLWSHGIEKPPHKIKVRIKKDGEKALVSLFSEEKAVKAAADKAEKKAGKKSAAAAAKKQKPIKEAAPKTTRKEGAVAPK